MCWFRGLWPLERRHPVGGPLPSVRPLLPAVLLFGLILPLARADQHHLQPPARLPFQTPVADVVLSAIPPASAFRDPAWPLRPGEPLRLAYPLRVPADGIDPYGWRFSPSRGAWRMHAGQDLLAAQGTPVLAMLPGQVVLVDVLDGYGLTVVMDHGRGWQTLYAHLLDAAVAPGDLVSASEPIARVGMSGRVTAPHLHVELRRRFGDRVMALDPTPLLDQASPLLSFSAASP